MGSTLGALESRCLVGRDRDPQDGRRVVLSVPVSDLQVLRTRRTERNRQLSHALSAGFTRPELNKLMEAAPLLERLAQSILTRSEHLDQRPSWEGLDMSSRMKAGSVERCEGDRYKWLAPVEHGSRRHVFMSALDGSIVIISLPAIFRGIHLDPPRPGNVSYLLWMIMGYRLVQAVLVVTLGRLGDMFGRVRIYNAGFAVLTAASILWSFDPYDGGHGALWLIGWRVLQALGGSMLAANSAAILTDAFPSDQRGLALGINQSAALAGDFIGLLAGGLLATWDWRAVFWVNVPVGVFGTLWADRKLRETDHRHSSRIDWYGKVTSAVGLGTILVAITNGIQPYRNHTTGWGEPVGVRLACGWCPATRSVRGARGTRDWAENRPSPLQPDFRIRVFTAGSSAGLAAAIARGGLQFMLIIWLQGIWLPLHGYDYSKTAKRPCVLACSRCRCPTAFSSPVRYRNTSYDRFGACTFCHRRNARVRWQLHRPDAAAHQLSVLGLRPADHREWDRYGPVQQRQLICCDERRPPPGSVARLPECVRHFRTQAPPFPSGCSSR